ncbi:hypothetical protein [Acinetobacter sp. ANC 4641]|uniref:hypothetical protein n=1 Tax=Acinetobacter sp. ANC 4641 TaxID=2529847 RepID=UPI00103F2436|nr:hypothetical protein [Acinetobacter sp. ANC 4641]TCB11468.1 hypothetical protein E0H78_07495 [Acinetobacter sp. ANC 4641]
MNMMFKPELIAPSFVGFKVVGVETNKNVVMFVLENGCVEVECEMVAKELTETGYVEDYLRPEYGHDVEYTRLEVELNDPVIVVKKGYTDLVDGQKLRLTEEQVCELNTQLEYLANDQFQEMQAA